MGGTERSTSFGRYFLHERIAVGGMAEIFKASYRTEGDFEKTLVIKRILPHLATNEEFIAMFRDEAMLTVKLTHANIVQVFDFGRLDTDYYLAMEYVQGQNLRRVMRRCEEIGQAALPIPFAVFVAAEVAKGLAYAHTRKDHDQKDLGIIHRDVTPSNVLVSYEGEVKIADFGIAKAASRSGSTQQGVVKGKAAYIAPEQLTGKVVDARLDVWALGAVTWEMLTGKRLVTGETDIEVLGKLMSGDAFPKPSSLRSTISSDVDRVVMKALERNPAERYPNAAAFQKELLQVVTRFAVSSVEASSFLTRIFREEIEAEKTRGHAIGVRGVDPEVVEQGAALESTAATHTQRSPKPPWSPEGSVSEPGQHTRVGTPNRIPLAEVELRPPPPRTRRGVMLGSITLSAAALAALAGLGMQNPDVRRLFAGVTARATAVPTAMATAEPGPSPAGTPAEPRAVASATGAPDTPQSTPTRRIAGATPRATPSLVAAVATAAPRGFGVVSVDAEPWGEIYIDGAPSGRETPAFDLKVPAGRHEIRIVNPVQKVEAKFTVDVKAGETIKKGSVTLLKP